jgi:hypothetical protein
MVNSKVPIADPIYPKNGIQSASFSVKKGQAIASILTLGIYCPVNYSYALALSPRPNAKHHISKRDSSGRRNIFDSLPSGWHTIKLYSRSFTHDTVSHKPVLVKRWLWGLINSSNQNYVIPNSSDNGGVQSMDIHVNAWQGIATVLSLGIYCPVTYRYRFAYLEDEY